MQEDSNYKFHYKDAVLGAQFLFVAFGALVLVPYLTGMDVNVALFGAGIGTLCFQFITRKSIPPVFLASSFAFIPAISVGSSTFGMAATASGLIAAGIFYMILGGIVRIYDQRIIKRILPPIVAGPVIVSIGLLLSPVAVYMAIGKTGDGVTVLIEKNMALMISLPTLMTVVIVSLLGKGIVKLLPILSGITVGYVISLFMGQVDLNPLFEARWLSFPKFTAPEWNLEAILFVLPIAIAPAVEHIGDMLVISQVTNKNYLEKPGIHRTLLGDGVATVISASVGGPPNTTYSEVTGAVVITKSYNPGVMTWTAITAIIASFIGKIGGFLATIPSVVMGGIMLLLFGVIASLGIKVIINGKVNLDCPRNIAILSIILTFSIGGMVFNIGTTALSGIGLGAITGIFLNLVLPMPKD